MGVVGGKALLENAPPHPARLIPDISMKTYFDKVFCINRDSRPDRWENFQKLIQQCELDVTRFRAHDGVLADGSFNGNYGCTASHRGILELICHHGWERTLIFEDDAEVVQPGRYGDHTKNRLPVLDQWNQILPEIPDNWDMLFLGGHYGSPPLRRLSKHVIRINTMLTASSYAVSLACARALAPHISGIGPIDSLYGNFQPSLMALSIQPRLFIQYLNMSDLQHIHCDNSQCMLDPNHEAMV